MNHPQPNELTDFLYSELDAAREAEVTRHLETCDDCRGRVDSWRAVRQDLAAWDVPLSGQLKLAPATTTSRFRPLRWAVAAMVLLGTGFGMAQLVTPKPDMSALRAELRDELKQELAASFTTYAGEQASRQQEFEQVVAGAVNRIEAQQLAQHAMLRKDMETVAVHAEQGFARLTAFNSVGEKNQPQHH